MFVIRERLYAHSVDSTAHAHFAPHRSHVPDTYHSACIVSKYNGQMERHMLHINPM
jgi:hypothetical protein